MQAVGRVLLAGGRVYAHAVALRLQVAGLHVRGPGELLASDETQSSVSVQADDVLLYGGLLVKTAFTSQRWDAWEQLGLRRDGHQGITVQDVTVDGSAAAGIYVVSSPGSTLVHVVVRDTRADQIQITAGAGDGQVLASTLVNSGDDGVAVVSYNQDGALCQDIMVSSPRVMGTAWGRGLSVVDGTNITETDIDVQQSFAAAVCRWRG